MPDGFTFDPTEPDPVAAETTPFPAVHNGIAPRELPGPERFTVREQPFELHLLDAIYEFRDLADQCRQAGQDHRAYLQALQAIFVERHGVQLTLGEVDWLNDELEVLYARKKKERADSIASALTSLSSTGSTLSA